MGGTSRKARILERLAEWPEESVSETGFVRLRAEFAPIGEDALRKVLRAGGKPMHPLVEGIRQESFEALERTLMAMLGVYAEAAGDGDRARMLRCRRAVIRSKDHALLAMARLDGEARQARQEMVLWMRVWLENPGVFPEWLTLRRQAR